MPAFQLADATSLTPAIGYIRVSLAREEMISPELQRESITMWATRTGHRIIDWVQDLDATGSNFKRKIMRVIERVEAGDATVIAVWKYSRFGRTRRGIEINLARIEEAGGQLISATEEVDATTATGWFQRDIIFSVATFESKRSGEIWKETHDWRRNHGLPATGQKRFGYTWYPRRIPQLDGTFKIQEERYEPDPKTAPVVKELYERYVAGDGFVKLVSSLNEREILNTRGNPWELSALRHFLDGGFAAGYLRLHDPACTRQPYRWTCPAHKLVRHPTHQHTAIISDELWDQYLQRRSRIKATPPRTRYASYPLAGLVKCGLCGSGVHRGHSNKGKDRQYVCRARKTKGSAVCAGRHLSERLSEMALKEWLAENVARAMDEGRPGIPAPARESETVPTHHARKASLQEQIAKLERGIARQMRSHALSDDDDADGSLEKEHQATLKGFRVEKSELVAALAALDDVPTEVQAELLKAAAVPIMEGLLAEWDLMPAVRLNALLQQVVRRIEIHEARRVRVVPAWEA